MQPISSILSYLLIALVLSTTIYAVVSRNMPTPFRDSLTPHQRRLQSISVRKRAALFFGTAALVAVLIFVLDPFAHKCTCKYWWI